MNPLPTPAGLLRGPAKPTGTGPGPAAITQTQDTFTVHLHSSAYGAKQRMGSDRTINAAVQVLRREHQLTDASAYAMLVQGASDSRLSLGDKARGLLAEACLVGERRPSDAAGDLPSLGASDVLGT
jgi:hypothetical protein